MTASRCLHHAQRISAMPVAAWAGETQQLPTDCGHDDCTTRDCRKVCQTWLRMQFKIRRSMKKRGTAA